MLLNYVIIATSLFSSKATGLSLSMLMIFNLNSLDSFTKLPWDTSEHVFISMNNEPNKKNKCVRQDFCLVVI